MAMDVYRLILIFSVFGSVFSFTEQGVFEEKFTKASTTRYIPKSLFKGTEISLIASCNKDVEGSLEWVLRETNCMTDIYQFSGYTINEIENLMFNNPDKLDNVLFSSSSYMLGKTDFSCTADSDINIKDWTGEPYITKKSIITTTTPKLTTTVKQEKPSKSRRKREVPKPPAPLNKNNATAIPKHTNRIYEAWKDGLYMFALRINQKHVNGSEITVRVEMKGKHGYLSALEWPFLPFYAVMCCIYVVYALVWLIMCAMNWRDLLRIQFWISAVILLGLIEKAVYIEYYRAVSQFGKGSSLTIYLGLFLTCLKRTLARVLIVIACLGYGIVKPRLGNQLQRVVALAFLFLCFSCSDEFQKAVNYRGYNQGKKDLITAIPLAIIDALFCWWIFTSLLATMKTLRIRRNAVKLSLYSHFTNTLVLAVLISLGYIIWSLVEHRFNSCLSGWKGLWIDEAFWHFSFCFILGIIIVLWRPTINDQRFASTPLLDDVDDEENETSLNESFSTKKRTVSSNGPIPTKKDAKNKKTEEDLKWIDENIPTTVVESSLPNLINDSDEEILNTKFEMSKMD